LKNSFSLSQMPKNNKLVPLSLVEDLGRKPRP
jgi:hypothetical protein